MNRNFTENKNKKIQKEISVNFSDPRIDPELSLKTNYVILCYLTYILKEKKADASVKIYRKTE